MRLKCNYNSSFLEKKFDPKKAKTYFCWKHKLFVACRCNMKTKEAYTDPWIMHLLTRDLRTNDFCGNNCSLFLEILASLKLVNYTKLDVKPAHSTRLRLEDWELTTATLNQKGLESSLSRCFTHGISMHQNGGFCMFCETWIEFVFLCDTWFSLCIFTWKVIFSVNVKLFSTFLWCVKRPITYAWNCFERRYRGPSCFCLVHTRCKDFKKKIEMKQFNLL